MTTRKPVGRKFGAFWGVFGFVAAVVGLLFAATVFEWAKPDGLRALGAALTPVFTLLGGTYLAAAGGNVGEYFATRRRRPTRTATVVEEAPLTAPDPDAFVHPGRPS